jgi:hypothetical protein
LFILSFYVIAFLVSEEASGVSGEAVTVAGGASD